MYKNIKTGITKNNEGIEDKVSGGVNISNYNGEIMLNKNNGCLLYTSHLYIKIIKC